MQLEQELCSKDAVRAEAVETFRSSQEYVTEVGSKAAAKIHDTYLVAEKYLKDHPDGDFDDFIR